MRGSHVLNHRLFWKLVTGAAHNKTRYQTPRKVHVVKYNPPALLLLLQIAPHAVAPRVQQLVCSGSPGDWRSHRWGGWVRVRRGRLSTVVNGRGQPHGSPPSLPFYATLVSYFKPAATIDSFARRKKKRAGLGWLAARSGDGVFTERSLRVSPQSRTVTGREDVAAMGWSDLLMRRVCF